MCMALLDVWNRLLWERLLPVLLPAAAVICGFRLKWRPLSCFPAMLRDTYGTLLHKSGRRQKQVFAAALAAMMGTGNLAGTALALMTGGAGAIFWMWVSALLGMLLVYAENVLGTRMKRVKPDGTVLGGTFAYLDGCGKAVSGGFALFCIASALGMGSAVQSNTLALTAADLHIPPPAAGLVTALLLLLILRGGSERVRAAAFRLMPLLCGGYLLGCALLLILHRNALPAAFLQIFREAFGLRAAGGGIAASVLLQSMSVGLRRGIFTNEAGIGSSALLHAESTEQNPDLQGKWAAAEVFADTVICCSATALVILTAPNLSLHAESASALLLAAFSGGLGRGAGIFLAVSMILLAFATMIGWYPAGLLAVRYRFGERAEGVFLACYVLAAFAGALGKPEWLWTFCDCCNGMMALPNLFGLLRGLHLKPDRF